MDEDELRRLAEMMKELIDKVCQVSESGETSGSTEDFEWTAQIETTRIAKSSPSYRVWAERETHYLHPDIQSVMIFTVALKFDSVRVQIQWQETDQDSVGFHNGVTFFVVDGMFLEEFLTKALYWKVKYL